MKTSQDPRHLRRIHLMQALFSKSFRDDSMHIDAKDIIEHLEAIDSAITNAAPEWPIDKIARIDLAILRLATYELCIEKKEPQKVIIDEAIELAKEFGNDLSAKFINGALGALIEKQQPTI